MANKTNPVDLGEMSKCNVCKQRFCSCSERKADGSWSWVTLLEPPVNEFCNSGEVHPDCAVTPTMKRIGHIPHKDEYGVIWFLHQCPGCKVVEWIPEDGRPK